MTCSYTWMPLRNTLSSRNCNTEIKEEEKKTLVLLDKARKESGPVDSAAWSQAQKFQLIYLVMVM
jgi:hypothetical protein